MCWKDNFAQILVMSEIIEDTTALQGVVEVSSCELVCEGDCRVCNLSLVQCIELEQQQFWQNVANGIPDAWY